MIWLTQNRWPQRASLSLALSFLLLVLVGCGNSEYHKQIALFQAGVTLTSESVGSYYEELNQFERELYLQSALLHPDRRVLAEEPVPGSTDPNAVKKTPLLDGPFSEESIKARMDAIALLGVYGKRLAELAGTDAPARFGTTVDTLGKNLTELSGTFNKLSGAGDATAASYINPIAAIVRVIGEELLAAKRDKALARAIQQNKPNVDQVLNQLEKDLDEVIVPLRLTGHHQTVQSWATFYNNLDRDHTPLAQRQALIERIGSAAQQYQLFKTMNPSDAIRTLRAAHDSMANYAANPQKQTFADLVSALSAFSTRAQQIANAVQMIRKIRRGEA